jgi:hypothetical protein
MPALGFKDFIPSSSDAVSSCNFQLIRFNDISFFLNTFFPNCFLEISNCNRKESLVLFLHTFSVCLGHKMHYREAESPPVTGFML